MTYKRQRPIAFKVVDVTYQTNSFNGQTPYYVSIALENEDGEWKDEWGFDCSGISEVVNRIKRALQDNKGNLYTLSDEEEKAFELNERL